MCLACPGSEVSHESSQVDDLGRPDKSPLMLLPGGIKFLPAEIHDSRVLVVHSFFFLKEMEMLLGEAI